MTHPIVGLLFDAWSDLDRVLDGLTAETAAENVDGGSSFAWTLGHITSQIDSWISVRQRGSTALPYFESESWRMGGTGVAEDFDAIKTIHHDVRASARMYLEGLDDAALERTSPYTGALPALQGKQVSLRWTLQRMTAHTYFHIGEIASVRSRRLGHSVGDYPGPMSSSL